MQSVAGRNKITLPFRPAERSALLAACLSEARTQSVGKLAFKKDAVLPVVLPDGRSP
jgi:hypothetical protein